MNSSLSFRSRFVLLLCVLATCGVVACGDDDTTPEESTPTGTSTHSTSSSSSGTTGVATTGTSNTGTTPTGTSQTGTTGTTTSTPGEFCDPCTQDADCGDQDDVCIQLPNELTPTCAGPCEEDSDCPSGATCVQVQDVPPVQLCVPDNFLCEDRCVDVACGDDEICDPRSGECQAPLGLCDLGCLTVEAGLEDLCGGPDDLCLFLEGTDERFCARDCLDDPTVCPEGYFCASVGEDRAQCVPDALTCVDRCSNTSCEDDEACDPLSGECVPRLGLCDIDCTNNALCGDGPEDICLNIGTEGHEESFCSIGCEDARDCPLNYFCAELNGRDLGACVPLDLTCVDRCSDVDCGENANCDPQTGGCIESRLVLCDECGNLPSGACGGQEDLCLNLGEDAGTLCSQDCSDTNECPQGYTCRVLTNTTRRACIPEVGDCLRCAGVECAPDETCDPGTGECISPQTSCLEAPCPSGEICNPDTEECEVVGEMCTFETRLQDCFGPVRKCSATRSGTQGVCAVICQDDDDCTPEAPRCEDLYRVGRLCVPDGLGAPNTCGITALDDSAIGRPCGSGVSAACPSEANTCLQGVDPDIAGFCSTTCTQDSDCAGQNTCQAVRGQNDRFCLPNNCLCLAGQLPPDDAPDLLTQALSLHNLSRCTFALDSIARPTISPDLSTALLQTPSVASTNTQPLAAVSTASSLSSVLSGSLSETHPTQRIFLQAAAQLGHTLEARSPSYDIPNDLPALAAGLRRFTEAAGGTWDPDDVQGDLTTVAQPVQDTLAQILFAAANALEARNTAFAQLTPEQITRIHQYAPYLMLRPPSNLPPVDQNALLADLQSVQLAPLLQATADLLYTLEQPTYADVLRNQPIGIRLQTPVGWILLGNPTDDTYDPAQDPTLQDPIAVLVDPGGDDTYRTPIASTITPIQGVAVAIDVDGNDQYIYTEETDPRDQDSWLPSDADGRLDPPESVQRMDGPVSLSDTGRQGSGRAGVAVLVDLGEGNDTYRSLRMSQGSAVVGAGVLIDSGGADQYDAEAHGQGAGVLGVGLLVDRASEQAQDTWRIWHAGQGFGGPMGTGFLIDEMGPSNYLAVPATGPADVLYFAPPDRSLSNTNHAQGAGAGLASNEERPALGGGVGVLFDAGGDDTYQAAIHAQGSGRFLGAGYVLDVRGSDTYEARYGSQGNGALAGSGALLDEMGDDRYNLDNGRLISALLGHGDELGVGVCVDRSGADQYRFANSSAGAGLLNGAGLFFDLDGLDTYTTGALATLGVATSGRTPDDPRNTLPTFGIFIDAGSESDAYNRIDLEGTLDDLVGNERAWTQPEDPNASEAVELGAGVDGVGATGYE